MSSESSSGMSAMWMFLLSWSPHVIGVVEVDFFYLDDVDDEVEADDVEADEVDADEVEAGDTMDPTPRVPTDGTN